MTCSQLDDAMAKYGYPIASVPIKVHRLDEYIKEHTTDEELTSYALQVVDFSFRNKDNKNAILKSLKQGIEGLKIIECGYIATSEGLLVQEPDFRLIPLPETKELGFDIKEFALPVCSVINHLRKQLGKQIKIVPPEKELDVHMFDGKTIYYFRDVSLDYDRDCSNLPFSVLEPFVRPPVFIKKV